jgi:hypothetical protein
MLENEPIHLIMYSIVRDNPILPITVNRTGVPVFWSKTLWMRFLQGTEAFLDCRAISKQPVRYGLVDSTLNGYFGV